MEDPSQALIVGLLLLTVLLIRVRFVLRKPRPKAELSLTVVPPDPVDFALDQPEQALTHSVPPAEREVVA